MDRQQLAQSPRRVVVEGLVQQLMHVLQKPLLANEASIGELASALSTATFRFFRAAIDSSPPERREQNRMVLLSGLNHIVSTLSNTQSSSVN